MRISVVGLAVIWGSFGYSAHANSGAEQFECAVSKLEIVGPKLLRDYHGPRPAFEFTITNHLDWPIAGFHFDYKVFSEGRQIPWSSGNDGVWIAGGIEPGETKSRMAFNVRIPSDAPDNLTMKYEIVTIVGPDDEVLRSSMHDENPALPCKVE